MCGVVLQEPRSVHRIRYDVEGGRIDCKSLTLAEVATIRLRHADERVHAAGIAAKDSFIAIPDTLFRLIMEWSVNTVWMPKSSTSRIDV